MVAAWEFLMFTTSGAFIHPPRSLQPNHYTIHERDSKPVRTMLPVALTEINDTCDGCVECNGNDEDSFPFHAAFFFFARRILAVARLSRNAWNWILWVRPTFTRRKFSVWTRLQSQQASL